MYFSKGKEPSQSAQNSMTDLGFLSSTSQSNRPSSAIQKNLFNFSIYYADKNTNYTSPSAALAAGSQIIANGPKKQLSINSEILPQENDQNLNQQMQLQYYNSNNLNKQPVLRQLKSTGREGEISGARILMQNSVHKFKPINNQNNNKNLQVGNNGINNHRSITRIKLVGFSGDPEFQQMKNTSVKIMEANEGMLQFKMDEIESEIDYDLRLKYLKRSSSSFLPAYKAFRNDNVQVNVNNFNTSLINNLSSPMILPQISQHQSQNQLNSMNKRPFYFLTEKNEPIFTLKQLQDKIPLKQQAQSIIEIQEDLKQQQMQYQFMQQQQQKSIINGDFITTSQYSVQSSLNISSNLNNSSNLINLNSSKLSSSFSSQPGQSITNLLQGQSSTIPRSSNLFSSNSFNLPSFTSINSSLLEDLGQKQHVYLSIKTSKKQSSNDFSSQGFSFFSLDTNNNANKEGSSSPKLNSITSPIGSLASIPQFGLNGNDSISSINSIPSLIFASTPQTSTSLQVYNNGEAFKVIIELYPKIAPKACENFVKLCEGFISTDGNYLTFRNTQALRIKKNGFIQMGFSKPGISIYNGYFEDESFAIKHDRPGIIGYCNRGCAHSNSGQFYITLSEMKSFDRKMVAFGRVVSGFKHLEKLNKLMLNFTSEIPPFNINICDSGVLPSRPSTNQSRKSNNANNKPQNDLVSILEQDHVFDEEERIQRPDIFYYKGEIPAKVQTYEHCVLIEAERHKEVAASEYVSLMLAIQSIAILCAEILQESYKYQTIEQIRNAMKETFVTCLSDCQSVALLYDTKDDQVFLESNLGKYVVVFTSLDVDQLADLSSCGSLFVIYRKTTTSFRPAKRSDLLQSGENIYGAGYIMYGHSTQILYHTGYRLNCFTLDPQINTFILTHPRIKAAKRGGIISCDESKLKDDNISKFIRRRKVLKEAYVARYVGSPVADFHRTLLYGGILIFPSKVVNIYDAFCLSYIVDKAWDRSSCGQDGQVLIKKPVDLTDKVQLYIGFSTDVLEIDNLYLSIRRKNSLYKIHEMPSQKLIKSSYSAHKQQINSPTQV